MDWFKEHTALPGHAPEVPKKTSPNPGFASDRPIVVNDSDTNSTSSSRQMSLPQPILEIYKGTSSNPGNTSSYPIVITDPDTGTASSSGQRPPSQPALASPSSALVDLPGLASDTDVTTNTYANPGTTLQLLMQPLRHDTPVATSPQQSYKTIEAWQNTSAIATLPGPPPEDAGPGNLAFTTLDRLPRIQAEREAYETRQERLRESLRAMPSNTKWFADTFPPAPLICAATNSLVVWIGGTDARERVTW